VQKRQKWMKLYIHRERSCGIEVPNFHSKYLLCKEWSEKRATLGTTAHCCSGSATFTVNKQNLYLSLLFSRPELNHTISSFISSLGICRSLFSSFSISNHPSTKQESSSKSDSGTHIHPGYNPNTSDDTSPHPTTLPLAGSP